MVIARHMIAAFVSLLIVFTNVATIEARAASGPIFSLVICSDNGAQEIAVDAEGNPVSVAHICLECCLVAHDVPKAMPGLTMLRRLEGQMPFPAASLSTHVPTILKPRSRAPPAWI